MANFNLYISYPGPVSRREGGRTLPPIVSPALVAAAVSAGLRLAEAATGSVPATSCPVMVQVPGCQGPARVRRWNVSYRARSAAWHRDRRQLQRLLSLFFFEIGFFIELTLRQM